jgi:hypothetical protein
MRILKNLSREWVKASYSGRELVIKPKGSLTIDESGRLKGATDYLLQTFGFLREITPITTYPTPKNDEEVKKVVKKARGVKKNK